MNKKLNSIMLIDDDVATNFLHKMVIDKADCANNVIVMESGFNALEYLSETSSEKTPPPELIFLDINMPKMNGWEFLEKYTQLPLAQKAKAVIIMLSTSLNPDDKDKAGNIELISGFKNKPLTKEMLQEVIENNF